MAETVYGFIGIGEMGGPMALRLFEAGIPLVAFDCTEATRHRFGERGVPLAHSVDDLASRCDVIFACLPTPKICLSVAREVATAPGRRTLIYVEMSTVGVDAIREIGSVLEEQGVTLVDSPISGGPRAVPFGKLTAFASGSSDAVDRLRLAYTALSDRFFYLGGEIGLAQAMKVGNNLLAAANLAITSEVVRMLERAGIAPATAIEIINVSTGRNRASEELFTKQILTSAYRQGARLEILAKDTQLAMEAASHYCVGLPLGSAISAVWTAAAGEGFAQLDITRIYDWTAKRNGA